MTQSLRRQQFISISPRSVDSWAPWAPLTWVSHRLGQMVARARSDGDGATWLLHSWVDSQSPSMVALPKVGCAVTQWLWPPRGGKEGGQVHCGVGQVPTPLPVSPMLGL